MSTAGLEKQPTGSQHFLQRHHEQSPLGAQLGASLLSPASPRRSVFEGVFRNSTRPRSNSCVRPGHHSPRRPSPTLTKLAIPRKPPLMVRGGRGRLDLQQSPACRNLPVTCRPHKPLASQPWRTVSELHGHFKTQRFVAIYGPSQGLQPPSDFPGSLPDEKLQRTAARPTLLHLEHLKKIERKIPEH